jgi:HSP20 family protein
MKTLSVYKPFAMDSSIAELGDVSRMMDEVLGSVFQGPGRGHFARVPAVDVVEEDKAYKLFAELPGLTSDDVKINLDGGTLTIESAKEEKSEKKEDCECGSTYVLRERRNFAFSRSFKLPENANPDAINAVFKNGLLTLEIQKREEAQKKTIAIN